MLLHIKLLPKHRPFKRHPRNLHIKPPEHQVTRPVQKHQLAEPIHQQLLQRRRLRQQYLDLLHRSNHGRIRDDIKQALRRMHKRLLQRVPKRPDANIRRMVNELILLHNRARFSDSTHPHENDTGRPSTVRRRTDDNNGLCFFTTSTISVAVNRSCNPAAILHTNNTDAKHNPFSRANTTSGTNVIPTTSANGANIRISAAVSRRGPSVTRHTPRPYTRTPVSARHAPSNVLRTTGQNGSDISTCTRHSSKNVVGRDRVISIKSCGTTNAPGPIPFFNDPTVPTEMTASTWLSASAAIIARAFNRCGGTDPSSP